jgi:hypothetical protein
LQIAKVVGSPVKQFQETLNLVCGLVCLVCSPVQVGLHRRVIPFQPHILWALQQDFGTSPQTHWEVFSHHFTSGGSGSGIQWVGSIISTPPLRYQ